MVQTQKIYCLCMCTDHFHFFWHLFFHFYQTPFLDDPLSIYFRVTGPSNEFFGIPASLTELLTKDSLSTLTQGLSNPEGKCAEGWYCSGGASESKPSNFSSGGECEAGYFCPKGSSFPTPCSEGMGNQVCYISSCY